MVMFIWSPVETLSEVMYKFLWTIIQNFWNKVLKIENLIFAKVRIVLILLKAFNFLKMCVRSCVRTCRDCSFKPLLASSSVSKIDIDKLFFNDQMSRVWVTPTLLTCADNRLHAAAKGLFRNNKKAKKLKWHSSPLPPFKCWAGAGGWGGGVNQW